MVTDLLFGEMSFDLHLGHSSSGGGLANMSSYPGGAPNSRPTTVNGNFSRSASTGQGSPSATPGFGSSSSYTASSFATSQYSGQAQPLNLK
jgi:hypothetical protein